MVVYKLRDEITNSRWKLDGNWRIIKFDLTEIKDVEK